MTFKQKSIWSMVLILVALGLYWGIQSWTIPANESGSFTMEIVDQNAQTIAQETLSFVEGEVLYDVLVEHFELGCASPTYSIDFTCSFDHPVGKIILSSAGITTDWTTSYFALYRNDQYVSQGVSRLKPQDGDVIRLVFTRL